MSATHLLDTGWIVRHLRGDLPYTKTMNRIGADQLAVSVVTVGELHEGVCRSANGSLADQTLRRFLADKTVLPLTEDIARLFGQHRARLRQANQLIGDLDLLIDATCLQHGLTVLTTNPGHFQRIPGLSIVSTPDP